jgi:hypothetical protein
MVIRGTQKEGCGRSVLYLENSIHSFSSEKFGHVFGNQSVCQLFATLTEFLDPFVRHGRKVSWISLCVIA